MINTTKTYYSKNIRPFLKDIRFIGLIAFLVIVLLVTWSGIKSVQTNYNLQKQISNLAQENQVQKLKNSNLNLENSYFNTNQYLELSARQNFGLAEPGETEVIIPQSVALSRLIPLKSQTNSSSQANSVYPYWQSNFQAWINFFLHRK
jgi:cell division protein FtsB